MTNLAAAAAEIFTPLTLAYMLARPEPTLVKYPEDNVLTG